MIFLHVHYQCDSTQHYKVALFAFLGCNLLCTVMWILKVPPKKSLLLHSSQLSVVYPVNFLHVHYQGASTRTHSITKLAC